MSVKHFLPSLDDKRRKADQPEANILAALFEQYGQRRPYGKNEFVFREDDRTEEIYWVQTGLIKISQSAHEGQGITLFLRRAGEVFGAAEVLTKQRRQRFARCIVDSEVRVLSSSRFTSMVLERPEALYALTVSNARRLLHTQRYVETLISWPVAWRLAHLLLQLGDLQSDNEVHVSLPLTHEEISYLIGCTRQTVTETLSRWRAEGLIHYDRKQVIIYDADRLLPCP